MQKRIGHHKMNKRHSIHTKYKEIPNIKYSTACTAQRVHMDTHQFDDKNKPDEFFFSIYVIKNIYRTIIPIEKIKLPLRKISCNQNLQHLLFTRGHLADFFQFSLRDLNL